MRFFPDQRTSRRVFLLACITIALLSHLLFVRATDRFQKNQSPDFMDYYRPVANNLLQGDGFVLNGKPALVYPPGIPMVYAGTFQLSHALRVNEEVGIRLLQTFFAVISSVLIALLALPIFGVRTAFIASVLWSTYPFNLWLTRQSDVTNILVSLLLLSAMLFMNWAEFGRHSTSRGFLLGAVLAFSALMKPSFLGLPIIFLALGYICRTGRTHRDRRIFSASLLFGYCLLLAPWEGWAHHASGQWIPLCLNGPNVLIDGLTFGTVRHVPPVRMPSNVYALTQRAVSHYSQLKTTPEILHFVGQQAREHPGALAELYLVKAARSWYGNESHTYESIIAVIQLCYTPFVAHGLLLLRKGPEKQRWLFFLIVGIVFYFWTMTVLTSLPLLRYLVPALSLMMIPAGFSLARMLPREQVESTVKELAAVS